MYDGLFALCVDWGYDSVIALSISQMYNSAVPCALARDMMVLLS